MRDQELLYLKALRQASQIRTLKSSERSVKRFNASLIAVLRKAQTLIHFDLCCGGKCWQTCREIEELIKERDNG
ncbi:MAG: hypothetical protein GY861_18025 [bacterium]|nr:hypothetical protein [bacterium]